MPVDLKIARRWKIKHKKGPSVHIWRTAEDIELKFGTHVFLINISLHTKNKQILRGWVTWPISFDMEWPLSESLSYDWVTFSGELRHCQNKHSFKRGKDHRNLMLIFMLKLEYQYC